MWIHREGCDIVQLDAVKAIEKITRGRSEDYGPYYAIRFHYNKDSTSYSFSTKEACEEYYEALKSFIGSQEIPLLKI